MSDDDCTARVEKAESRIRMPESHYDAHTTSRLLQIQIRSLRKDEGLTWDEIGKIVSLPGYVCRVIAGETVGKRPSVDRQSGT